jgi:hypothetical protein
VCVWEGEAKNERVNNIVKEIKMACFRDGDGDGGVCDCDCYVVCVCVCGVFVCARTR